eukprot:GHVR01081622.1.p1 GENE.GHVR01081622.1~~GHVR01081622.1.p1  ORF type:complete len:104 (+),score=5.77 GHVR01081622.1:229-540(+)
MEISERTVTEAPMAVPVGISFLILIIAEIIFFAILDIDTYYKQARHIPSRLGCRRRRRRRNTLQTSETEQEEPPLDIRPFDHGCMQWVDDASNTPRSFSWWKL